MIWLEAGLKGPRCNSTKTVYSFHIAPSTMWWRLAQELGMKSVHLRCMPHEMDAAADQSRVQVDFSKRIITIPELAEQSNCHAIVMQLSHNCCKRRVLVLLFIFTANDMLFWDRWNRRSDRSQDQLSENNTDYLLGQLNFASLNTNLMRTILIVNIFMMLFFPHSTKTSLGFAWSSIICRDWFAWTIGGDGFQHLLHLQYFLDLAFRVSLCWDIFKIVWFIGNRKLRMKY
jgi:hypothetical protein